MNKDRKDITIACLQTLLATITPEDLQLYTNNPEQWIQFSKSISKLSVVLADTVIETLSTEIPTKE